MWSYSSEVPVGDIFQLQDELSRGIVESLALSLSDNEQHALGRDIPRSAKAYEFYLRANQLNRDLNSLDVARDLYLQCLEADSKYAPAWAQLGRVYRVIAKYRGQQEQGSMARAESALNRALELNPTLSIADRFYAEIEVDVGRAMDAMVRLVRRASTRSTDPDLYAGLVAVCRYCGLPEASLAAGARARRLDRQIRTSLAHTSIMLGDYVGAAEQADQQYAEKWISMAMLGHADAVRQCRVDAERARMVKLTWLVNLIEAWGDMLEGRGQVDALCAATEAVFMLPPDLDGWFYAVLGLVQFGGDRGADRAVQALADLVTRGFFPYDTFIRHAWLQRVRHRSDFAAILDRAKHRQQEGGPRSFRLEERRSSV